MGIFHIKYKIYIYFSTYIPIIPEISDEEATTADGADDDDGNDFYYPVVLLVGSKM